MRVWAYDTLWKNGVAVKFAFCGYISEIRELDFTKLNTTHVNVGKHKIEQFIESKSGW